MKKCLLIVDDEPSIRLILERYFSKEYEVVVKENGLEAINWLHEGNLTDCIVADLEMPVMDGLEFINQLRSTLLYQDIPLVMLSGKDDSSHKIKCLKQGADDYMVKPFNPEELDIRINKMLKRIKI